MSTDAHPAAVRVEDLQLHDVAPDLCLLLDASEGDVDGLTATSQPHPAFDPASAPPGTGAWLVRLTDRTGRSRVAEVEVKVAWREDTCWHESTQPSPAGGLECRDCGALPQPPPQEPAPASPELHCPDCAVVVLDHQAFFGVHTASCGYWDERCLSCHRRFVGPGTAPASPDRPQLCTTCAAQTPASAEA